MKKTLITFSLASIVSLSAMTEKQFLSDYCERLIDESSEKLTHCYITDLCEWYYIYGQMTAYQDVYQLTQYFEE